MSFADNKVPSDFIRDKIAEDIQNNKNEGRVVTRFPPEPNGFLHIGHAKSICLNFGIAQENQNAVCHLRMDDTNPETEDIRFVEAIEKDVQWLGFDWAENFYFASDYFEKLYEYAVQLIKNGKAYVCDLNEQEIREYRGTVTTAGKESPYRNRTVEENLDLFQKMREGQFTDGSKVLRAKIDMSSPNMKMRDPLVYRIRKADHYRTGNKWCIYPMYDFAHCLSDSIEGITHSLCTLEFENNRELYDWFLEQLDVPCRPQQIEFARLNLSYTVLSKRQLAELVNEKYVDAWDDPRMPTISGLRARGYTPASIRDFCSRIGVAKADSIVDMELLEHCIRTELNKTALRFMVVLDPIKVIIDNYPDDKEELLDAVNNPEDPESGKRKVPFSKVLYIERGDFREDPPRKFYRLYPGNEVRLRYAYYITCQSVVKDEKTGEIKELHCTYDPETKGGWAKDGRKVKSTIHWVSAKHAISAEVRLYDKLFTNRNPNDAEEGKTFTDYLNPDSKIVLKNSKLEPNLSEAKFGKNCQFERKGYFCISADSNKDKLIFNRTVTLRDTWKKIEQSRKKC